MARPQFGFDVAPGVRVIGWGKHRYAGAMSDRISQSSVSLDFRRGSDGGDGRGPEFSLYVAMSPEEARRLASALIEASDKAETQPLTDDSIREPGVG
jgi:hypothetical protein